MEITIIQKEIENRIFTIRGLQIMLDSHLAEMYNVETRVFNQAVKRNIKRFPDTFRFQLNEQEWENLRLQIGTSSDDYSRSQIVTLNNDESLSSQIVTSSSDHGGRGYLPYAFTEQGVAMISAVLRSETAVKVSIQIMNAFVEMRKLVLSNAGLFQRHDKMGMKHIEADQKFEQIFRALESRDLQPDKGIFFEGEVFDAYAFVAGIIKKANKSVILIDNYVDETVLTILAKRDKAVSAGIYTRQINKQLELDLKKHNEQYPEIFIRTFAESHDRFLIIDRLELYHFGASLKDLGKKLVVSLSNHGLPSQGWIL